MNRGTQSLSITVVADSGTDERAGLSGSFMIKIIDGKDLYEFEHSLPE